MGIALGPAAGGEAWTWGWQAYLGVWAVLAVVGAGLVTEWRRAGGASALDARRRLRLTCAVAGWVVLWLAIDWPLGALAGYLLSAAAMQYLLINLVAAPLLLFGLPRLGSVAPVTSRSGGVWRPPLQLITGAAFAAVLFGTAVPAVVDAVRPSALGSLALVSLWLATALALWWPVLRRDGRQLRYLAAVAYLFVPFIMPKIPGLLYIVADTPVYEVYARAPRVVGLAMSPSTDQLSAGAVLWSAGTVMLFVSLGALFASWYRDERRATAPVNLQIPADPELVAELFAIPGAWVALERVIGGLEGSLPAEREGYELKVAVRTNAGVRGVIVELHAPLESALTAGVAASMRRDLARYLASVPAEHRAALEGRLAFEVVPFRARAS